MNTSQEPEDKKDDSNDEHDVGRERLETPSRISSGAALREPEEEGGLPSALAPEKTEQADQNDRKRASLRHVMNVSSFRSSLGKVDEDDVALLDNVPPLSMQKDPPGDNEISRSTSGGEETLDDEKYADMSGVLEARSVHLEAQSTIGSLSSSILSQPGAYRVRSGAVYSEDSSQSSSESDLEEDVEEEDQYSASIEPTRSLRFVSNRSDRFPSASVRSRRVLGSMTAPRSHRALGFLQTQSRRFWNRSALQAELVVPPVHAEATLENTQEMARSKCFVYILILLASLGIGIAAFFRTVDEEYRDFRADFTDLAMSIVTGAEDKVALTVGVMKNLGVALTAYALTSNSTWPFVTIPYFEARAQEALEISGAELIAFLPLVSEADDSDWIPYAIDNQGWIAEGLSFQGESSAERGEIEDAIYSEYHANDVTHGEDGLTWRVPFWQFSPAPANATDSPIMRDMFETEWFRHMADDVLQSLHAVLSSVFDASDLIRYSQPVSSDSPRIVLLQPVFSSFDEGSDDQIVGFVLALMRWDRCFTDAAQEGTADVIVQVEDTCGSSFEYIVEGPDVYLAEERVSKYNTPSVTAEFPEFARRSWEGEPGGEEGVRCDYAITVFPTAGFENSHTTSRPLIHFFYVVCAFVFTAAVFSFYDWSVQRYHNKVIRGVRRMSMLQIASSRYIADEEILESVEELESSNSADDA